ncbi:MAG: glycerol acyltransferase [Bacteroidetes bacterium]|nr:MAG: glycerol acyltransferase [Bacteroidota bacterium]
MENINIAQVVKNSNSELLNKLPDFAVRILTKIVRQDGINHIINKYSDYEGVDFLPKVIEELNLKIEIEGKENLPDNGKCFFVANHPFGLIDGIILTNTVGEKYGKLKAIGNDAFKYIPNLKPIIANVNVFGQCSRDYIRELEKIYASDFPITHFPAGLVSRITGGKIQEKSWEKSFIRKAAENQRDIVPIKFYGRNSNLFYTVYIFRQIFRLKTNIELILLPREMFKKKNKTIKVKIGKPISYKSFDKTLSHKEWAEKLRKQLYQLN